MNSDTISSSNGTCAGWPAASPTKSSDDADSPEPRWKAVRIIGQALAVAALYNTRHPVARKAIEEAHAALARALSRGRPLFVRRTATGWELDGNPAPRSSAASPALAPLLEAAQADEVAFWPGLSAEELAAVCELANAPPVPGLPLEESLQRRGVRRVSFGSGRAEPRARSDESPAAPPSPASPRPSPAPPAPESRPAREGFPRDGAPPPAPPRPPAAEAEVPAGGEAAPQRPPRKPFTAFLQRIVQRSGADPKEQATMFKEALSLLREGMREALEGQIAAAQTQLEGYARELVAECRRAQQVLASVAEGRVTVDSEGRVLMMNAAAEQIAGRPLRELAGLPLEESVAGDVQMLSLALSCAAPGSVAPRVILRGAEETCEAFRKAVALVCDPDGRVVGTYGVLPHAAEAKEMAREREDFVSRVTHELKAPLTAITAALELLEARSAGSLGETESSLLDAAQRNSTRLRRLIDDLLDFSSLQNGTLQLRLEPNEPHALVADSVSALEPWAQAKGIRLSVAAPRHGTGPILADAKRITQVLTNLLSNALKVTPAGGSVEAGVSREDGFARFWVRDTGCGIARKDQSRIFEKFVQVRTGRETQEGVGLGLAIVADLVARHCGTVSVDSEPGRGSTFYFTVPLA